jgi:hypothetical protein
MSQRLLTLFQTDTGESALSVGEGVTFDCFVRTLDYFNPRTPDSVKLNALFRLYDCDGDGRVSERDLRAVMRHYVGTHISEAALRVMCRNTMTHALQAISNNMDDVETKKETTPRTHKEESKSNAAHKKAAVPPLALRNNVAGDDAAAAQSATNELAECEGRYLTFEQFSRHIGVDALEAMNVAIPIRE